MADEVNEVVKRQVTEIQIRTTLLGLALILVFMWLDLANYAIFFSIIGFVALGGVVLPLFILGYSYFKINRKGIKSFYNPLFGMIELHIGRTKSVGKMVRICLNAKRDAKKLNKDILFFTNHYPAERLVEFWGDALEVRKATLLEYITFYITFHIITMGMKKGKKYPLLRCVVKMET